MKKANKVQTEKVKVLQPSDWSFKLLEDYIANGGDASDLARYGNEILKKSDIIIDWFSPDDSKWITKILTKFLKLEGRSLLLQLECIRKSNEYDIIYFPADRHLFLLALARRFRICKAPVLMICHFSYDTRTVQKFWKKILLRIEREIVYRGIDKILFACDTIKNLVAEDGKIPERHMQSCAWGADLEYFARGKKGEHSDIQPYYFAAGGANRDYKTLIEAFSKMPYRLVLCCPRSVKESIKNVPENVIFHHNKENDGLNSYPILRSYLLDAKAILLPIFQSNHVPNGATVLVEGLAAGKPVIITDLSTNFIDVEKENIGLKVKIHDCADWVRAIEYLESHPEHVELMGKNSYNTAINRYNYKKFVEIVLDNIHKLASG